MAHRVGQFQAVHASRHMNVGKQQRDIRPLLQDGNRLVCVSGLKRLKTSIFDQLYGKNP